MHTNVRYVGINLVPYNILFIILYSPYYCPLLSLLTRCNNEPNACHKNQSPASKIQEVLRTIITKEARKFRLIIPIDRLFFTNFRMKLLGSSR